MTTTSPATQYYSASTTTSRRRLSLALASIAIASTLASMYTFIFQLFVFLFFPPYPMMATTPPSPTFPGNNYDDALASPSFKATRTAVPTFPDDDDLQPRPHDLTSLPKDNCDGGHPRFPTLASDNSPQSQPRFFGFTCPGIRSARFAVHICVPFIADVSPSPGTIGHFGFEL